MFPDSLFVWLSVKVFVNLSFSFSLVQCFFSPSYLMKYIWTFWSISVCSMKIWSNRKCGSLLKMPTTHHIPSWEALDNKETKMFFGRFYTILLLFMQSSFIKPKCQVETLQDSSSLQKCVWRRGTDNHMISGIKSSLCHQ